MEWAEIVEPKTKQRMYANLRTGECSWEPPENAQVKRTKENQWWELYDRRTRRFYYYSPTTAETVWTKPAGCDLIPLAKLQMLKEHIDGPNEEDCCMPVSFSTTEHGSIGSYRNGNVSPDCVNLCEDLPPKANCANRPSLLMPSGGTGTRSRRSNEKPTQIPHARASSARMPVSATKFTTDGQENSVSHGTIRSPAEEENGPVNRQPTTNYLKSKQPHFSSQSSLGFPSSEVLSQATQHSVPSVDMVATSSSPSPSNSRSLALPLQPKELQRIGVGWSRESAKTIPLSPIGGEKRLKRDSLRMFKYVQQYMGDKKPKGTIDSIVVAVLEIARNKAELVDELFLQIVKQLTDNPKHDSARKGWELLGICLGFVVPTTEEVRRSMISFVEQHSDPLLDSPELATSNYAKHCAKRLEAPQQVETRAAGVSLEAVRQARYSIFYPPKFGASLEEQMGIQGSHQFPHMPIPWIENTLIRMILENGGEQSEGLFRIASEQDQLNTAIVQLEVWVKPTVKDSYVVANLLKQWLRQLPNPLIPNELYSKCLASAANPKSSCDLIDSLPEINKRVLIALLILLKRISAENVVRHTKMDVSNLAMLMAPNILRCDSDDPATIFANSRAEMEFMRTVILHYDTSNEQYLIQF